MNRWVINKLGLQDFWYYDMEEFQLEEGKLLLRGSNGSGKSVTMQSFIPLILDGNKSPSRLDPFGTTSRRLENYLLDESTDEKTAYLYMEFKRQDTDNYITIGMGMKAVKNKPLQAWYFGITDNRRIGIDFMLYREGIERVALTKKQLENAIGTGGFYTESQKQYMAKVNELLFGFETLDQYEELLSLIINVRSPKLSKDFKPTKIYEILKQSLKVLTEEDLRPMSEAMENMDNLKERLEEYGEAQKACKHINYHYKQYNKYSLVRKSQNALEAYKGIQYLEKQLKEFIAEQNDKKNQLKETKINLEATDQLLKQVERQYDELSNGEVVKIERELQNLKEEVEENKRETSKKDKQLDEKKDKERDLRKDLSKYETNYERILGEVKEQLEELDESCENLYFEEGKYIAQELQKEVKEYEFRPVYLSLERYRDKLKGALKEMDIYEGIRRVEEKLLEQKDEVANKQTKLQEELAKLEELLLDEKETYKVSVNEWKNIVQVFKFENINAIFRMIDEADEIEDTYDIENYWKEQSDTIQNQISQEIYIQTQEIECIEVAAKKLEEELHILQNTKEVDRPVAPEIAANRARLKVLGIPFMPLYKVVDFKTDIPEQVRGYVEGALVEMGILDALVINPEDREVCMRFGDNQYDKYIICGEIPNAINLKQVLEVDESGLEGISDKTVESVLDSICLKQEGLVYVNEQGQYQISILAGQGNLEYSPKYIGSHTREKHRQLLIEEKEEELKLIGSQREEAETILVALRTKQNSLEEEYAKRPIIIHVLEGIKLTDKHRQHLELIEVRVLELSESYIVLQKSLQDQKIKVFTSFEGLTLPHKSSILQEELEGLEDYKKILSDIEQNKERLLRDKEIANHIQETIDEVIQDIDGLYYDMNQLKYKARTWQSEIIALEGTLKAMNIDDVREQITRCIELKKTLPPQKDLQIAKISELKVHLENIDSLIEEEKIRKEALCTDYAEKKQVFEEEYKLGYLEEPTDEEMISLYQRLTKDDSILKKNKDDYTNALMVSVRDNNAPLKEFNVQNIVLFEGTEQSRIDLVAKIDGKDVAFNTLVNYISRSIEELQMLISDEERKVFEEVLLNTISSKITSKIYLSKQWVNKINQHMENMNTSSSLRLSLKWVPKKADAEEQLDITQLLELLERGDRCNEEDFRKLAKHFADKVKETIRTYEGTGENRNYHTIIKDVLDYRNWYEFRLSYIKDNEKRKELTNNAFFQFSGGEKAMSMYVPLFSAVYARYDSCKPQCPRIVVMDEAFAGVDEKNIRDMFKILKELDLDYILNSQALWGDYDTVERLAICEIIRDTRDDTVFVMRYKWNGKERILVE
ncbi:MAG: SbcC/MukB-like Walker B domain-containing protein [Cellulosilyticaceae bacterium]